MASNGTNIIPQENTTNSRNAKKREKKNHAIDRTKAWTSPNGRDVTLVVNGNSIGSFHSEYLSESQILARKLLEARIYPNGHKYIYLDDPDGEMVLTCLKLIYTKEKPPSWPQQLSNEYKEIPHELLSSDTSVLVDITAVCGAACRLNIRFLMSSTLESLRIAIRVLLFKLAVLSTMDRSRLIRLAKRNLVHQHVLEAIRNIYSAVYDRAPPINGDEDQNNKYALPDDILCDERRVIVWLVLIIEEYLYEADGLATSGWKNHPALNEDRITHTPRKGNLDKSTKQIKKMAAQIVQDMPPTKRRGICIVNGSNRIPAAWLHSPLPHLGSAKLGTTEMDTGKELILVPSIESDHSHPFK